MIELLIAGVAAWIIAALLALANIGRPVARALLGSGGVALIALAIELLPGGSSAIHTALSIGPAGSMFMLSPQALWLLGFGLPGAVLACWLGSPIANQARWLFGAAASLIGALGVFGMQDAVSFLVAWEIMSFGGAVMILSEALSTETGRPVLFMLSLLEAGAVALMLAFMLLANQANSLSFADFAAAGAAMPLSEQLCVGLLLLIGFGAKIGLLPFYEWFPGAYGAASGATGAIMSGAVLNAAFFGLSRGLMQWLPIASGWSMSIAGFFVIAVAVLSAILTALYAFQQESWRELLSLSSAENGSIAVCLLGAALMFRQDGMTDLTGLAWTVALLHLAGHALAKGAMFLCADGVFRACNSYAIVQNGLLRRSSWTFGLGALFAAMSLAAMPPQAGFVSEWYLFQTFFQGFRLINLASRLTAALAGAGLALTAAIAFATFVKVFGIGLLGRGNRETPAVPFGNAIAVGLLGVLVVVLAVGMPAWLVGLEGTSMAAAAVQKMHVGWLLVPATGAPIRLTGTFAFISPSKLVIAMPLLALLPIGLLLVSRRRPVRASAVWYGGRSQDAVHSATTALTFSNALRTFYSFIYRPIEETERETAREGDGHPYFIRRLVFTHEVAPIFGPRVFAPLERSVVSIAVRLRIIQSGHLSFYLSLIGALLIIILFIALL
jgi:hydrogenase-4 component B